MPRSIQMHLGNRQQAFSAFGVLNLKKNTSGQRKLFGPGTTAMLVSVTAFGVYNWLSRPAEPKRFTYEADMQGQLRQVLRPSYEPKVLPALFKPEPSLLLSHGKELALSQSQVQQIVAISDAWKTNKQQIEGRLSGESKGIGQPKQHRVSVTDLQDRMVGYSELSRVYNRQRVVAWESSVAVLNRGQRDNLTTLLEKPEVQK